MFTLVAPHLGRVWLDVGHILFVTSLFAALLAFHNTIARYAFALGRERVLPAWLGTTGRHNSAPKWGSLTQSMLALVVLMGYVVAGLDPFVYLFFWLTVLGGLGVLILMAATSLAVVIFFGRRENRNDAGLWSGLIAPVVATGTLASILYLTVEQFPVLMGIEPGSPWRWVLPVSFAVVAIAGMVWAAIIKARSPQTYATIGLGANSATGMPPVEPVAAFGRAGHAT
jgi:amino acid transporter